MGDIKFELLDNKQKEAINKIVKECKEQSKKEPKLYYLDLYTTGRVPEYIRNCGDIIWGMLV